MGRLPWATDDQLDWLEDQIPEFHASQTKERTKKFLSRVEQEYFDKFWKVPGTNGYHESMLDRNGHVISKAQRQVQLGNWFWNRRQGKILKKKKGRHAATLNLVPKKPTRLQPYQAYMNLHKVRIMPKIRAEYKQYLVNYAEEHCGGDDDNANEDSDNESGGMEAPDAWWKFACARAKEMLVEETEEVKREVEERADKAPDAAGLDPFFDDADSDKIALDPLDLATSAMNIKEMIDLLPKALQGIAARIEELLGWKTTILSGGPRPDTGEFAVLSLHQGKTINLGKQLPDATPQWDDLEQAFSKFVVSCYPPDVAIRLKAAYQEGLEALKGDLDSTPEGAPSTPTPAPDAPGSSTRKPTPTNSDVANATANTTDSEDYEGLREATIARNKKLFDSLGLGEAAEKIKPQEKGKGKGRGKEKGDNTTARKKREKRGQNAAPTTRSTRQSATETTPVELDATPTSKTSSPADATPSTDPSPTQTVNSTTGGLSTNEESRSGDKSTPTPSTPAATTQPSGTPLSSAPTPTVATPATSTTATPPSDSGMAPGTTATGGLPPSNSATPLSISTAPPANAAAPPVSESARSLVSSSTSKVIDDAPTATPEWVTDAMRYFALIEGGERWKGLVNVWLEFEHTLRYPNGQDISNRLAADFRPEEVRLWMKNHRLYEKLPKIKSPKQFSVSWKRWWISLQPSSRTNDAAWPLPRSEPADPCDWDVVARGGCNGLFLVVLTLAWWLWAMMNENEDSTDVFTAIEDVSWVCKTVTTYVRIRRQKESESSEIDGERPHKRPRLE